MRTAPVDDIADLKTAMSPIEFPPHDPPGRDNNFNFLRLLFASLVILTHSCDIIDGDTHREVLWRVFHTVTFGTVAVDGFFLVSGFLIVQSWQRQPSFGAFLRKRALRIYPAFIAACLVCAFLVGPHAANETAYFSRLNPGLLSLGILLLKAPVVPRTFAGLHYGYINGAVWTISHEFYCYLLVPLLAWLGFVKHRSRWLGFSLVLLLFPVVFPARASFQPSNIFWCTILPESPEQMFRLMACFCAGGCFYLFRDELSYRRPWLAAAAAVLWLCLHNGPCASLALPTVGAYLLFWFAFADLRVLNSFKSQADVSYGVYLYGWPVQSLLIWYFLDVSPWEVSAATFVICLGIGWLSWHAVESPFLRMKSRHDPRDIEALPEV